MYTGICKMCGKVSQYKYKSFVKQCCSHKCSNTLKWETREKAKTKQIKCITCKELFEVPLSDHRIKDGIEIKFCSRECMGIGKRKRKFIKCKHCGKEFETTRNKFCSKECANEYRKANYQGRKLYKENGYIIKHINGYNKKGNAKMHRLIMEEHLGRKLKPKEIVHHINGIKSDNRIENLKVMTWGEHSRYHRELELANGEELFGR